MRFGAAGSLGVALGLGFAGLGIVGCSTSAPPAEFAALSTEYGVMRWQRGQHAVTGRASFSRSADGGVRIRLDKSGETHPLQLILTPGGLLTASGSLADRQWSGAVSKAPPALATWVTFVTTYQHAADLSPGIREIHSPAHRFVYEKSASGLRSLSVAGADLQESIAVAFLPPSP